MLHESSGGSRLAGVSIARRELFTMQIGHPGDTGAVDRKGLSLQETADDCIFCLADFQQLLLDFCSRCEDKCWCHLLECMQKRFSASLSLGGLGVRWRGGRRVRPCQSHNDNNAFLLQVENIQIENK